MSVEHIPKIGNWFKNSSGQTFEVVALDEKDGTIEIQYFDGAVEELDTDSWEELLVEPIEPPEDWSGSMDIEREDYGVDLDQNSPESWGNPLDDIERDE
jgi:hypothetical protein